MTTAYERIADDLRDRIRAGESAPGDRLPDPGPRTNRRHLVERTCRTCCRAESAPFALVRSYLGRDLVATNSELLDAADEPWPGGTQS